MGSENQDRAGFGLTEVGERPAHRPAHDLVPDLETRHIHRVSQAVDVAVLRFLVRQQRWVGDPDDRETGTEPPREVRSGT